MTHDDFLHLLASIDFPTKYWALCDRFPVVTGSSYSGSKDEVLAAFHAMSVSARYDGRDRSYQVESEKIGATEWGALFAKQRSGPEFMICGVGPEGRIGTNFAVLAYEAKRAADPSFNRNPFAGPAPYPRPSAADSTAMAELLKQFIALVREIKEALRERENAV